MNELYGENRFYRHVASHWIEMQQALIAQINLRRFRVHPSSGGLPGDPELMVPGCSAASSGTMRTTGIPMRPTVLDTQGVL